MLGSLVLASLLIAEAFATQCQYFFNTALEYPVGIGRCSYYVYNHGGRHTQYSFEYECINENLVAAYTYGSSFTCEGTHSTAYFDSNNATFDCTTTDLNCGKLFGYKTPCTCTASDGDCYVAVEISLVDQICVYDETFDSTYSYEWAITCGSIDKANAVVTSYLSSDCSGSSESTTYAAGCSADYSDLSLNGTEVDIIVCPGNMATFSLSLFAALIVGALSL